MKIKWNIVIKEAKTSNKRSNENNPVYFGIIHLTMCFKMIRACKIPAKMVCKTWKNIT